MIRPSRSARRTALLLVVLSLTLSGCMGIGVGTLGEVLGGLPGTGVSGEVRRVDERRREIRIRTPYGRSETVDYDRDTRVVYRRQRYSVRALEPGDEVTVQVQRGARGGLYADLIHVERSVRERRGARYPDARERDRRRDYERAASLRGRVGRIDRRGGWFQLRGESRGEYVVILPARPSGSTAARFRRLRSGDHIRVEGRHLSRGRVELLRFR